MKKRTLCSLIIIILLACGSAQALMVDVPLEVVIEQAELIVQGRISRIWSDWNEKHDLIHTYVVVVMDDLLKGPGQPINQVTFRYAGGEVDGIGLVQSDTPRLAVGEEVIVFLQRKKGKYYRLASEFQGKFTIEKDKLTQKKIVSQAGFSVVRRVKDYLTLDPQLPGRVFLPEFKRVVLEIIREQQLKQRK